MILNNLLFRIFSDISTIVYLGFIFLAEVVVVEEGSLLVGVVQLAVEVVIRSVEIQLGAEVVNQLVVVEEDGLQLVVVRLVVVQLEEDQVVVAAVPCTIRCRR